ATRRGGGSPPRPGPATRWRVEYAGSFRRLREHRVDPGRRVQPQGASHGAELGRRFEQFVLRYRAVHDAGAREEPRGVPTDLRAANRDRPLAVAAGVAPSDQAAEVAALERLERGDRFAGEGRGGAADRRRGVERERQRRRRRRWIP